MYTGAAELLKSMDVLGWIGFVMGPIILAMGLIVFTYGRRKGILSATDSALLAGVVAVVSTFGANFAAFDDPSLSLFVAVACGLAGMCGVWLALKLEPPLRGMSPEAFKPTPLSPFLFRAGLMSIGIALMGLWSLFINRGWPPYAPQDWHKGIIIAAFAASAWALGGLHLLLPRLLHGTMPAWEHAFHLVMMVSLTPTVFVLFVPMFTGNRWIGLSLMALSLLELWLQVRRLSRVFPSHGDSTEK
jgi:hypothetical protein